MARLRGRPLELTYKEFELLKYLAQHAGRVFTRAQLLQEVWGYDYFGGTRTVDVHVRRLRAKLGAEYEQLIGTVRNVGYKFVRTAQVVRAEDTPRAGRVAERLHRLIRHRRAAWNDLAWTSFGCRDPVGAESCCADRAGARGDPSVTATDRWPRRVPPAARHLLARARRLSGTPTWTPRATPRAVRSSNWSSTPSTVRAGTVAALAAAAERRRPTSLLGARRSPRRRAAGRHTGLSGSGNCCVMRADGRRPAAGAELADGVTIRTFEPGRDEQAMIGGERAGLRLAPRAGRADRRRTGRRPSRSRGSTRPASSSPRRDGTVIGFHWTKVPDAAATSARSTWSASTRRPGRRARQALTLTGCGTCASAG